MGSIQLPTLRWGIVGTGLISSWFVQDLVLQRKDLDTHHILQAIGSSSVAKGEAFAAKHAPNATPKVYGSYHELYNDPNVDIVYIGTPHAFHKQNCLDAIAAGKHVLCEKPFTINAREAKEVFEAAKAKGVFIMEAMWTRFTPLVASLRDKLFTDKVIGDVRRTFCDFGLEMDLASLGAESRLKNPELGAGSLLDIGVYSLTWGLLNLDANIADEAEKPNIVACQTLSEQIDIASSILLHYPSTGRQGILTSTTEHKTDRTFCRIEGTKGFITIEGLGTSIPDTFVVHLKKDKDDAAGASGEEEKEVYKFEKEGMGFYFEADAVAVSIAAGRKENDTMPPAETLRVMSMMDEIRRQGGARFPQDGTR